MTIVMNMSGYEIEREEIVCEDYGDEVMLAELVPQLAPVDDRHAAEMDKHAAFPDELAEVDVEDFLQKMYKYQR